MMLFLTFFPMQPDTDLATSTTSLTHVYVPPKRRNAVTIGSVILLSLFIVSLASIGAVATDTGNHSRTQTRADFLGTVAGSLAAVQHVPQIYFTWRQKSIKSLGIVTMLIQVFRAFLIAFFLWLRVGWRGWSTWLVYIVTGVLRAVLLFRKLSSKEQIKNKSVVQPALSKRDSGYCVRVAFVIRGARQIKLYLPFRDFVNAICLLVI